MYASPFLFQIILSEAEAIFEVEDIKGFAKNKTQG